MLKTFPNEQMYRYYVQVKDVNDFLVDDYAAEIIDETSEISGSCSESGRKVVMNHFKNAALRILFVKR